MKSLHNLDGNSIIAKSRPNGRHRAFTKDFLKQRDQANARERIRTHSVNVAFTSLRNLLPSITPERKLSKIEILRMARNYISHLTNILSRLSEKLDYESGLRFHSDCDHSACMQCDLCTSSISQDSIHSSHTNDSVDITESKPRQSLQLLDAESMLRSQDQTMETMIKRSLNQNSQDNVQDDPVVNQYLDQNTEENVFHRSHQQNIVVNSVIQRRSLHQNTVESKTIQCQDTLETIFHPSFRP